MLNPHYYRAPLGGRLAVYDTERGYGDLVVKVPLLRSVRKNIGPRMTMRAALKKYKAFMPLQKREDKREPYNESIARLPSLRERVMVKEVKEAA